MHLQNQERAKIQSVGVSKTRNHIPIEFRIPNHSQEPPSSSKALNQYLKDLDILCYFKIKIEGQHSNYGCIKDHQPYPDQEKMPNPIQEPPASSKVQNQDLKDMDVLCTFKIKIEPKFGIWVKPKANHCKAELVYINVEIN